MFVHAAFLYVFCICKFVHNIIQSKIKLGFLFVRMCIYHMACYADTIVFYGD